MQYFLFLATSFGFVDEAYEAAKDGIVEAVSMAHNNMQVGISYHGYAVLNLNLKSNVQSTRHGKFKKLQVPKMAFITYKY